MKILLTGSSGFVGQHFLAYCAGQIEVVCYSLQRQPVAAIQWQGIDAVVHLAGKAHDLANPSSAAYHEVNTILTNQLADAAKSAGVRHFIFVSTIKVYGNHQNDVLTLDTECRPDDDYGVSKRNAEIYLQSLEDRGFTVSIIRPPLVYGRGVKGNMARLVALCDSDKWLPLGNINNRRTMVYVDNLNAMLLQVLYLQKSGVFLAGDTEPVSTTDLVRQIRHQLGRPERLVSVPSWMQWLLSKLVPKVYIRLYGSLALDTVTSQQLLDFTPPFSTSEGLAHMLRS
ncbi:MAG: NAD-dependent epimerase/dehydratase family protein [Saprospiraceae bacterium]|nr:NAD-dependent epimerase/dehydratase family protein [Saprospiraceae bacterium]